MKIEQQNDKNYNKFVSKGVTHDRETGSVYNNVYPDVDRKSGLIIPKTLVKTEDRPKSQMKTSRHKRKRIESLEDVRKKLKKTQASAKTARRLENSRDKQGNRQRVATKEKESEVPKPKKPNVRTPKKPSVRKPKKSSGRKVKKASKKSQSKNGLIRSDRVNQKRHEFCIIQFSCV